jgi:peptidoglycan-N-acetylglucosamine deacetylase
VNTAHAKIESALLTRSSVDFCLLSTSDRAATIKTKDAMKLNYYASQRGLIAIPLICGGFLMAGTGQAQSSFHWPGGQRAAISLSFDDARQSQVDVGLPLLDKYGVKGTFYVLPAEVPSRLEGWKKALAGGHEVGNHSRSHPCTGNYEFSFRNALEDYSLQKMAKELDGANTDIQHMLGVKAMSFGYPCGQKSVGRGAAVKSYVPLVAERFLTGRGYRDEGANDPRICDLSELMGSAVDELDSKQAMDLVTEAVKQGRWLVLVSHEVGAPAFQTTDAAVLETVLKYAKDPANGIWIDTVKAVGQYITSARPTSTAHSAQRARSLPGKNMSHLWNRREMLCGLSASALVPPASPAVRCRVLDHRGDPLSPAGFTRFHVCDLRMRPTPIAPRFEPGLAVFEPWFGTASATPKRYKQTGWSNSTRSHSASRMWKRSHGGT